MKGMRIAAVACVVLILGCFIAMAVAMFHSNTNLFFIEGGVLVALLIIAFVLIRVHKKQVRKNENEEEK